MTSMRTMGWISPLNEPKRQNRFELLLEDSLRLTCNSVSIPEISVDKVEIHRMHNKYRVAGSKVEYGEVTLKFYDFIDNGAANALKEWHRQVYDIDTSLMGFPVEYKRDLTLLMYGPDNSVVESWLFSGAWPNRLSRSSGLDWTQATGVIEISVSLTIDEAKLILS